MHLNFCHYPSLTFCSERTEISFFRLIKNEVFWITNRFIKKN
ncbi:hypothetical protein SELA5_p0057 (plasmid) [Salmonella enterica subsp. enterica serovar Enteritidis str. LA5]|nr:hypothetical protein SELA5_p0057 [Salmonella enterica subsp. enterica serovar Enteritidis str. LA5]